MKQPDLSYPFAVRPLAADEGGGYLIEFPDLPGCMADGATVEEALREGADALRSWVETMRELGRPVPPPPMGDTVSGDRQLMRVPRSLHRRLAERAEAEGVSPDALAASLLDQSLAAGRV